MLLRDGVKRVAGHVFTTNGRGRRGGCCTLTPVLLTPVSPPRAHTGGIIETRWNFVEPSSITIASVWPLSNVVLFHCAINRATSLPSSFPRNANDTFSPVRSFVGLFFFVLTRVGFCVLLDEQNFIPKRRLIAEGRGKM